MAAAVRQLRSQIPKMQRGLLCSKNGRRLETIPVPVAQQGEVLVQNEVVASNPKDWKYPIVFDPYEFVEGSDTAGYVAAVGKDVQGFQVGDRVAGFSRMLSRENRNGCYAEYTIVPENTLFRIPKQVSFEEAATVPLACLTSGFALEYHCRNGLSKGETFVVNGAASSIGSYAVQLAKNAGLRVIGIAGRGGSYAREAGADEVVDYRSKTGAQLAEELHRYAFAHVYDAVSTQESVRMLSRALQPRGGFLSTVSPRLAMDTLLEPNVENGRVLVSSAHGRDAQLAASLYRSFVHMLENGSLRAHRHSVVPRGLAGVSGGLDRLQKGEVSAEKLVYRIHETP